MDVDSTTWAAHFMGRYLNAKGVGTRLDVTIKGASVEEIEDPQKKIVRRKLVVYLEESLPWVPSKTASAQMGELFGDVLGAWKGRKVTLFNDERVMIGKKRVGGIRVLGAPHLTAPITFEYKAGQRRPEVFTMIPTGDALATVLATHGMTIDAAAAALAADPIDSKRGPVSALPTLPEQRASFARFLQTSQAGQSWLARHKPAQTNEEVPEEGEE